MVKLLVNEEADEDIIVKSQNVKMSDDKLYRIQQKTYEFAEENANKFRLTNCWSVFASIGLTLFLTLITSEFQGIGSLSSNTVKWIAIIICAICLLLAFVLLVKMHNSSDPTHNEEREIAIEKAKNAIINKASKK